LKGIKSNFLAHNVFIKSLSVVKKNQGCKVFKKLICFFLKRGVVELQIRTLLKTFSYVYLFFFNNQTNIKINLQDYLNAQEFSFILKTTKHFKNLPMLLRWVTSLNHSQFDLNIEKVSKKYKKKLKKNISIKSNT